MPAFFQTDTRVERHRIAVRDRDGQHGYVEDQIEVQRLVRRTRVLGIVVCKRVLDEEVIPAWWLVQVGATGDRSGWRSKFVKLAA